ncbi:hypothetical protein GCM10027449_29740 [Sinomonas notoginsengisoli]|uniref:hypothetical protein n=1 Tax=Sinomonas notoginsengisoli TaxID=1457311 RepID=UPI001F42FD09|nr:hypothetical protein [Sinomonas notoginsengisoli]
MDLAAIAAELYALAPAKFTASRNAQAKQVLADGQPLLSKQIAKLPKPSAAAWAVNVLARQRPDQLAEVLDVGAALREAQEDLDPQRMRELGQRRNALLSKVVQEARAASAGLDVKVSDAAASELDQTLRAATADPRAAEALRSGLLVRPLVSNGLEPVDLEGALAVPGAVPELAPVVKRGTPRPEEATATAATRSAAADRARKKSEEAARRRERESAEAELRDAERSQSEAEAELADADAQARAAAARASNVADELAELRRRADKLEQDLEAAKREESHAGRARRLAERLVEQERRAVGSARERLDRLS